MIEDTTANISLDLLPYRGSVRSGSLGWTSLVEKILRHSAKDYEITNRMARLAINFYSGIDRDCIIRDRETGGKVLKEIFVQKAERIVGMTRDNPSFQRSLLKVPYAINCPNLWEALRDEENGLTLPMRLAFENRPLTIKHLNWAGVHGIGFHPLDGDLWIDLDNRTIHWECETQMYQYHRDLIEYVIACLEDHPFATGFGGVAVSPNQVIEYGDGVEYKFATMDFLGFRKTWGANCNVYMRKPELGYREDFKISKPDGRECPKCSSIIFKGSKAWSCSGRGCGYRIPFFSQGIGISSEYAIKLLSAA